MLPPFHIGRQSARSPQYDAQCDFPGRGAAVRVMVQDAGIPESQAMLISGHETRSMLERCNIVSLENLQDAGAKLDAWSRQPAEERRAGAVQDRSDSEADASTEGHEGRWREAA